MTCLEWDKRFSLMPPFALTHHPGHRGQSRTMGRFVKSAEKVARAVPTPRGGKSHPSAAPPSPTCVESA